jgi:predicted nucleic acid-binding protein
MPLRFLIDTNCFMQIVRSRPVAPDVRALLDQVPRASVVVTDFTVHSLGVVMARFGQLDEYAEFLRDVGIGSEVAVATVAVGQSDLLVAACKAHALDFDDAYQYVAAELHDLKLVSLDADFDRTPNGRLTPAAALQAFKDEQTK